MVKAAFEISVDDTIRVSLQKPPFQHYDFTGLHNAIMSEIGRLSWVKPREKPKPDQRVEQLSQLEYLIRRFHVVARQLKHRYNDRETLIIKDEYDVQDLLHALLKTIYEDVRPEEYTPSYAGGSSRMDFLLKKEKIVIEVKMASAKLKDKIIGDQLIIDIKRYQKHPDCETLVCFVYDPDGYIKNPVGLETDLSGRHDKIKVKVIVVSI